MKNSKTKKKSNWSLNIDEDELKKQVENYKTLKITESYRGISVLIISVFLGISLLLSIFGLYTDLVSMIFGVIIFLPILFFVYKGHRWAIILLMGVWTFEKFYQLYEIVQGNSGNVLITLGWWIIIMSYFVKALRVENARRKVLSSTHDTADSLFCHKCGVKLDSNSKFCSKCGTGLPSSLVNK